MEQNTLPKSLDYVNLGLPSGTLWASQVIPVFYTETRAIEQFKDLLPTREQVIELIQNTRCWFNSTRGTYTITGKNGQTIELTAFGFRKKTLMGKEQNISAGAELYFWFKEEQKENHKDNVFSLRKETGCKVDCKSEKLDTDYRCTVLLCKKPIAIPEITKDTESKTDTPAETPKIQKSETPVNKTVNKRKREHINIVRNYANAVKFIYGKTKQKHGGKYSPTKHGNALTNVHQYLLRFGLLTKITAGHYIWNTSISEPDYEALAEEILKYYSTVASANYKKRVLANQNKPENETPESSITTENEKEAIPQETEQPKNAIEMENKKPANQPESLNLENNDSILTPEIKKRIRIIQAITLINEERQISENEIINEALKLYIKQNNLQFN